MIEKIINSISVKLILIYRIEIKGIWLDLPFFANEAPFIVKIIKMYGSGFIIMTTTDAIRFKLRSNIEQRYDSPWFCYYIISGRLTIKNMYSKYRWISSLMFLFKNFLYKRFPFFFISLCCVIWVNLNKHN